MSAEEQDKVRDRWQATAQYWEKYRALIAQIFAPLTSALVEEAQIGPGQRVLDIGGGSGEPSLTISSIVGPTGSVMFTDQAGGMVEVAQAEAARRGLTNIYFKQCSADNLPFPDCTFDLAVARLSVMFFPDPTVGVREVLRVIRKDGSVSFVVWGPKEANPFFSSVNEVIDRFVETPPPDPDAPDGFRFAESGKLVKILESAGAKAVIERQFNFEIKASISFEQFWQSRIEMSEVVREKLAKLTQAQLSTVRQEAANAARKYFLDGTMCFPSQALVISGRKSANA